MAKQPPKKKTDDLNDPGMTATGISFKHISQQLAAHISNKNTLTADEFLPFRPLFVDEERRDSSVDVQDLSREWFETIVPNQPVRVFASHSDIEEGGEPILTLPAVFHRVRPMGDEAGDQIRQLMSNYASSNRRPTNGPIDNESNRLGDMVVEVIDQFVDPASKKENERIVSELRRESQRLNGDADDDIDPEEDLDAFLDL